jgi:hypothetical protein
LSWQVNDDEIRASGVYDLGYGPKNEIDVVHRREIVFVKQRCWVVFDTIAGQDEHAIESRFQFAPGRVAIDGATAHTEFEDANLLVAWSASADYGNVDLECGQQSPRGGWYSDSYGQIEPAPALSLSVKTELPWRSATLLFPYRGVQVPKVPFRFSGRQARIEHPELGQVTVKCTLP